MPTAAPLMAPITGFLQSKMRSVTCPPPSRRTRSSLGLDQSPSSNVFAPPDKSAPAQNALPSPVTITARTASSASTRSNASSSSRIITPVKAFIFSGRESVIVATASLTS